MNLNSDNLNLRIYGEPPYHLALVHGGPGAAGEMAPVARWLAAEQSLLEPLQTATSVDGQIEELVGILTKNVSVPLTLVGFSWGAWLCWMVAAHYPHLVQKLILISSGPFEDRYLSEMRRTRIQRMTTEEQAELSSLGVALNDPKNADKDATLARLGALMEKTSAYAPIASALLGSNNDLMPSAKTFATVWPEAADLRASGALLEMGRQIQCPVVAIHGDSDPHSVAGVQEPLSDVLTDFRLILLNRCGHKPWIERHARDAFFALLEEECVL